MKISVPFSGEMRDGGAYRHPDEEYAPEQLKPPVQLVRVY